VTIRLGPHIFDSLEYDAEADVLYASTGRPGPSIGSVTPEGHSINQEEETGRVVGVDLVNPRLILEREGTVKVTLPDGQVAEVEGIRSAIGGAAIR
jgi:uncharacterized protein YuzE